MASTAENHKSAHLPSLPSAPARPDLGCGAGDLLAGLKPSHGVGVDVSSRAVDAARERHPDAALRFVQGDFSDPAVLASVGGPFDAILLVNVVTHITDVQAALEALHAVSHSRTRVLIYSYSRLWQPLLRLAERLGLEHEQPPESWLPPEEIKSMLSLADFEVVRDDAHLVCPMRVPLLADLANRYLGRVPLLDELSLVFGIIARPVPSRSSAARPARPTVSVVIPCRNEEYLSFMAYALVGLTDFLDGYLARAWNLTSPFGAMLDSIADVLFYLSTAYFAVALFPAYVLPNVAYIGVCVVLLVVQDTRAEGQVTERTLTLVALNCLLASVVVTMLTASVHYEVRVDLETAVLHPLYLFAGSLALGGAMASLGRALSGRIERSPELHFTLVAGLVVAAVGVEQAAKLSVILALLAFGMFSRNEGRGHELMAVDLGRASRLFYVVLFVITGASLPLTAFESAGWAAAAFVGARAAGKMAGVLAFSPLGGVRLRQALALGATLLPMSSIALLLHHDVARLYPEFGQQLAAVLVAGLVVMELAGSGTGMTVGPHPVAYVRAELSRRGVIPTADLPSLSRGTRTRIAGAVIVRQRPGTAKGALFLTVEDESGMAQAIVSRGLLQAERATIVGHPGLIVEGTVESRDGSVSLRAERFWPLADLAAVPSHDFR